MRLPRPLGSVDHAPQCPQEALAGSPLRLGAHLQAAHLPAAPGEESQGGPEERDPGLPGARLVDRPRARRSADPGWRLHRACREDGPGPGDGRAVACGRGAEDQGRGSRRATRPSSRRRRQKRPATEEGGCGPLLRRTTGTGSTARIRPTSSEPPPCPAGPASRSQTGPQTPRRGLASGRSPGLRWWWRSPSCSSLWRPDSPGCGAFVHDSSPRAGARGPPCTLQASPGRRWLQWAGRTAAFEPRPKADVAVSAPRRPPSASPACWRSAALPRGASVPPARPSS